MASNLAFRNIRDRVVAQRTGVSPNIRIFSELSGRRGKVNIVAEGDSWFAYPPKNLVGRSPSNIVDHIFDHLPDSVANGVCLAKNGDKVQDMLSGEQRKRLENLLQNRGHVIHLFLFSAGGNDIAGGSIYANVKEFDGQSTPEDCIDLEKLSETIKKIRDGYLELFELRQKYAPKMKIIAHTYDYIQPNDSKLTFLNVELGGPWLLKHLQKRGVPNELHFGIIKYMLDDLKKMFRELESDYSFFSVVDTQGTLIPADPRHWKDEMHPTQVGFKLLADKIYKKMREYYPTLPAMS